MTHVTKSLSQAEVKGALQPQPPILSLAMLPVLVKITDALALSLATVLTYLFAAPAAVGGPAGIGAFLCVIGPYHLVVTFSGGYDISALRVPLLRLHSALIGLGAGFAALIAMILAVKLESYYPESWILIWFAVASLTLVGIRSASWFVIDRLRTRGRFALRTVIIGGGATGQKLAHRIRGLDSSEVALLGFIDDRTTRLPTTGDMGRRLGGLDQLRILVGNRAIDQVLIALPCHATSRLQKIVNELAFWPGRICLVQDLAGVDTPCSTNSNTFGMPSILLSDRPISGWGSLLKRLEDLVVASAATALFAPVMVLVAIAIKLDSPGPVFFRQRRYGFNNELIEIWKFRTMYHHLADKDARVLTTKDDPRVTPVGRFIRKYSLDELPQLLNVLAGEMSIVGPRPHALQAKADGRLYTDVVYRYAARHRVAPGITGWAQINGWRGVTDTVEKIEKRVEYDLYYIENWSLWFDLTIIARTAFGLFKDPDAY